MFKVGQVDDTGFISKSMRKGGLSTAKRAGVLRALRCQQSGHQSNLHKTYESDDDTNTEGNQDLPKHGGGFRKENMTSFFTNVLVSNVRSLSVRLPAKTPSRVEKSGLVSRRNPIAAGCR